MIEGSILADFKPAISCFSEDFVYCVLCIVWRWVYVYIFISE